MSCCKNKFNFDCFFIIGLCILFYFLNNIYLYKSAQNNLPAIDFKSDYLSNADIPISSYDNANLTHQHMVRSHYEDGMMILNIPKLNLKVKIMKNTSRNSLKKGPGLYDKSPLVGTQNANVCIAGHRTTYGAWFRNLDKLKSKDIIHINLSDILYTYEVEKVFVVHKNDWSVTNPVGYSALTLTTCHPPGKSIQRLVLRARLREISNIKTTD